MDRFIFECSGCRTRNLRMSGFVDLHVWADFEQRFPAAPGEAMTALIQDFETQKMDFNVSCPKCLGDTTVTCVDRETGDTWIVPTAILGGLLLRTAAVQLFEIEIAKGRISIDWMAFLRAMAFRPLHPRRSLS
jgi:hypothetical protein